jgi:hypothetical protein
MNPSPHQLHQQSAYPQSPDIPEPLEIHPSVDPELAKGLIAAVEHIEAHLEEFDMAKGFNEGSGKPGCFICHIERLSKWRRPEDILRRVCDPNAPLGHAARIYSQRHWYDVTGRSDAFTTTAGRLARIEHFLRTGA